MTSVTLFGAPLGYTADSREQWIGSLERAWRAFSGKRSGNLSDDLELLRGVFAMGASGRSLRAALDELDPESSDSFELPSMAVMRLDGRALITPEGRVLLETLKQLPGGQDVVIADYLAVEALGQAAAAHARWYQDWALRQVRGNLSAPVLGAALFLLFNGSIGESHAFSMPPAPEADRQLAALVLPIIGAFSSALGGEKLAVTSGVRSHWAFTQVTRLLGADVARKSSKTKGSKIYVRDEHEFSLVQRVHAELQRKQATAVRRALRLMLEAYRDQQGQLISLGISHEAPAHTRRLLAALVDSKE
jgi:hypothetical protein